jgi:hypothetical protein
LEMFAGVLYKGRVNYANRNLPHSQQ